MERYLLKTKKSFYFYVFSCVLAALVQVGTALMFQLIVDTAQQGNSQKFIQVGIFVVVYMVVDAYMDYLPRKTRSKVLQKSMFLVRQDYLNKVEELPVAHYKREGSSKFISRIVNDLKVIEDDYLGQLLAVILSFFIFTFSLITALKMESAFTFIMIVLTIIPLFFPYLSKNIFGNARKDVSNAQKEYLLQLENILKNFTTLRLFRSFSQINRYHQDKNEELGKKQDTLARKQGMIYGWSYGLSNITYSGTWLVGGFFLLIGKIDIGTLVAMTTLMSMIAGPIQYISDTFTHIASGKQLADEVYQFIQEAPLSDTNSSSNMIEKLTIVSLENVTFEQDEKRLLENVTLQFEFEKKYLVIGESGSGKTTLFNLIAGLETPSSGFVQANHKPLEEIGIENYYQQLSVIEQKTAIFDGTMAENVTVFKEADKQDILSALSQAGLDKWLEKNHRNLKIPLTRENSSLSGGEERRLDIARSLLKGADMILFDEPTTGLDTENAAYIEKVISQISKKIIIVIAHNVTPEFRRQFDEVLEVKNQGVYRVG